MTCLHRVLSYWEAEANKQRQQTYKTLSWQTLQYCDRHGKLTYSFLICFASKLLAILSTLKKVFKWYNRQYISVFKRDAVGVFFKVLRGSGELYA